MKAFTFTAETTQKVLDYLAARPFAEVHTIVNELLMAVKAQQTTTLATASTDAHNAITNGSGAEKTA